MSHVATDTNDDFYLVPDYSLPFELLSMCDIGTHCDSLATRIEIVRGEARPVCDHCFRTALEIEPDSDLENGMRIIGDRRERNPDVLENRVYEQDNRASCARELGRNAERR